MADNKKQLPTKQEPQRARRTGYEGDLKSDGFYGDDFLTSDRDFDLAQYAANASSLLRDFTADTSSSAAAPAGPRQRQVPNKTPKQDPAKSPVRDPRRDDDPPPYSP